MKGRKRLKHAAALVLAAVLAGSLAGCSDKEVPGRNKTEVAVPFAVEELEELPEPTEFPAKGYVAVAVPESRIINEEGETEVSFRESYLPVIVDQDKIVYGKLDSLGELLDMPVYLSGSSAKAVLNHTEIFLSVNSTLATYTNDFFDAMVDMKHSPILYEEGWYVPLDAFGRIAGLKGGYYGEDAKTGMEQLLLYPAEETVLDRMADFYPLMYSTYAFDYYKDLGYTETVQDRLSESALIVTFLQGLGSMDSYSWKFALFNYMDGSLDLLNEKYINLFADAMLQMDEAQVESLLKHKSTAEDRSSCVISLISKKATSTVEEILKETQKYMLYESPDTKLSDLDYLTDVYASLRTVKNLNSVKSTLGYIESYVSLAASFDRGDAWMQNACEQFLKQKDSLSSTALDDSLYQTFSARVKAYGSTKKLDPAIQREWWLENIAKVSVKGLSLLGLDYFGPLTLASTVWKTATNFFIGEELNEMEGYLTGVQGIFYETDAMAALEEVMEESFSSGKTSWTADDEEKIRYALSNVVKACYVTRYFGCIGAGDALDENHHPEIGSRQDNLNSQLTEYLVCFSDVDHPFGLMPADLSKLAIDESVHYPNVIFTISELTGQVLSWDEESPAPGVKMEIQDYDGTVLAEGVTDAQGMFDISVDMGDADSLDMDSAAVRTLTIAMNYKKYPVVLQDVEIMGGRKYQVDGLYVGERSEDRLVFLDGARTTEDGKTVIQVREIDLGEESFAVDVPDYQGGTAYTAYFSATGEYEVSEQNSFLLRDDVTFGTFYTANMPEGGIADTLLSITGISGSILPDEVLNRNMHAADEINAYVSAFQELNSGMSPVMVIQTVNSEVKEAEPTMINPD